MGKVDVAQKQYHAAIDALMHYLREESRDASAYFLLVRAYKAVGDRDRMNQAIAAYKRTSDAAKGSGEAQRALDAHRDQEALPGDANQKEDSQ
jgi:predicted Zn-dependent protease